MTAAEAMAKLVSNQLESSSALNSEAMTGWVASNREPSALDMKPPAQFSMGTLLKVED